MDPSEKKINKKYRCPICKITHDISFPVHFGENRAKYPFTYVFMHKFENAAELENKDKDILTTLYLDAHLNIRGVEALINEDDTNIVSKEDSASIITKLSKVILEMQKEMDILQQELCDLKAKYEPGQY